MSPADTSPTGDASSPRRARPGGMARCAGGNAKWPLERQLVWLRNLQCLILAINFTTSIYLLAYVGINTTVSVGAALILSGIAVSWSRFQPPPGALSFPAPLLTLIQMAFHAHRRLNKHVKGRNDLVHDPAVQLLRPSFLRVPQARMPFALYLVRHMQRWVASPHHSCFGRFWPAGEL